MMPNGPNKGVCITLIIFLNNIGLKKLKNRDLVSSLYGYGSIYCFRLVTDLMK